MIRDSWYRSEQAAHKLVDGTPCHGVVACVYWAKDRDTRAALASLGRICFFFLVAGSILVYCVPRKALRLWRDVLCVCSFIFWFHFSFFFIVGASTSAAVGWEGMIALCNDGYCPPWVFFGRAPFLRRTYTCSSTAVRYDGSIGGNKTHDTVIYVGLFH